MTNSNNILFIICCFFINHKFLIELNKKIYIITSMDENEIILKLDKVYSSEYIDGLIVDLTRQLTNINYSDLKPNSMIDLNELEYIDSNLSVVLYAYIKEMLGKTPYDLRISIPINTKLFYLLRKNNFCSLWNQEPDIDYYDTSIRITESYNSTDAIKKIQNLIAPKLSKILNKEYNDEFISVLGELCTNAFTHGKTDNLMFCGQFYPKTHKLSITFVNFGKTFQENIISYFKSKGKTINDYQFISWALKESNTTNEFSLGIGLARFMDLIKIFETKLTIISGNEKFCYKNNHETDTWRNNIFVHGTIINITFNLDNNNIVKVF